MIVNCPKRYRGLRADRLSCNPLKLSKRFPWIDIDIDMIQMQESSFESKCPLRGANSQIYIHVQL